MISAEEAAKAVNATVLNVRTSISQGRVPPLAEFDSPQEFRAYWDDHILSEGVEAAKRISVDGHTLNEVRLRNELVKLALLEMELEEKKQAMIYADVAKKLYRDVMQQIRDGLLSLPARHAPVLAAAYGVDPHKVFVDMEMILRDYCSRLSDEIEFPERKRMGRKPKGEQ